MSKFILKRPDSLTDAGIIPFQSVIDIIKSCGLVLVCGFTSKSTAAAMSVNQTTLSLRKLILSG